jgi:cytidylate kinase
MWDNISVDKCESFIKSHFHPKGEATSEAPAKPAITIARQEGAGGLTVASNLADYLQAHTPSREAWTVFSQQLVAKVLEEHRLHERVGDFMKEGHKAMLFDAVEEWMGLHPSSWTLVEKTNATILRLAQIGNVILVGRGANIVTRELQTVFHVYLVGSLEKRIERAQKVFTLDRKAAVSYIKKKDEARRRYLKDNFDKDINDPLLYHITINTDLVQHEDAAQLIGEEVIRRFQLNRRVRAVVD